MNILNDNFSSSLFLEDYHEQVRAIANRGYAQPKDGYYEKVVNAIDSYELYNYDREMFYNINKRRNKAIQSARWQLHKNRLIKREIENVLEKRKNNLLIK